MWSPWARPARHKLRQALRRWSRSQPATEVPRAATPAAPMAAEAATAVAAAIFAVTTAGTAASAVKSLGQLGETTSPSAVLERSASPAETITSGRKLVALLLAAHVSAVRREGALPRKMKGNYARTSAAAFSVCGIILRSSCRAVRHLPSPPWTSHDSDEHSTASSYGPPPPPDSYAPAPPMPPPPRPEEPPPPASPSESD